MYLSRLLLTGEKFRNPYEIHRALWAVFPEASDLVRDFLYRVEQSSSNQVQVLMQSQRQPEHDSSSVRVLASKAIELNLTEGRQLRFLLLANPIKTIADEQGRLDNKGRVKKCRIPLINEEVQSAWLKRKLNDVVVLKMVEIQKQSPLHFHKGKRPGKIQPYIFKGVLQVNNASALMFLMQQGIGPAKAFGCGMLSLAGV